MRTLSEIASEIRKDWKAVNYAAKPYLDAMQTLNSVKSSYYHDSGESIVRYFLANAGTWRGETAKLVIHPRIEKHGAILSKRSLMNRRSIIPSRIK